MKTILPTLFCMAAFNLNALHCYAEAEAFSNGRFAENRESGPRNFGELTAFSTITEFDSEDSLTSFFGMAEVNGTILKAFGTAYLSPSDGAAIEVEAGAIAKWRDELVLENADVFGGIYTGFLYASFQPRATGIVVGNIHDGTKVSLGASVYNVTGEYRAREEEFKGRNIKLNIQFPLELFQAGVYFGMDLSVRRR